MTDTPQTLPMTIKRRWSGSVIFTSTTAKTLGEALIEAVAAKTNLYEADLHQVDLPYGARLDGARLVGASLVGASLVGARLDGASLVGASLVGARLDGASLVGARLDGARLDGARLDGASLDGARLDGAKVARGSRAAFAGPVGDSGRVVYGFIAQPDDSHKKPWLVLVCGCFTGDEKAYRDRIGKYKTGSVEHKTCLIALASCKAIAATWKIEIEKPAKVAKAGGAT